MTGGTDGFVAPGFERVAEEFDRNFAERGDVGAAFAVCVDGEPVIDLWGGSADPGPPAKPWQADTLQLIFSGTKGLVATCLLMLIDRGALALEDRVCKHWPEFAANGKQEITVAQLVSHRARLPGVRTQLSEGDLIDDRRMAELLAAQAPEADPRAVAIYHPLTFGWLCGELIRRVDGRSVGCFFAEEVAGPLDLEVWIGLPETHERRVSRLVYAPDWEAQPKRDDDHARDRLLWSVSDNPPGERTRPIVWNERAFHAAEIPGAGGIGAARSIARLYSALACGGEIDGVRLLSPQTVALGRTELSRFVDPLEKDSLAFGVGFELQTEVARLGPAAGAFGHTGFGGSVHGAWPEQRLGFSYAMNELREDDPANDPRSQALLRALFRGARLMAGSRS
jgi:CubicO group peptidase (beta-lactamase class C family)